MKKFTILLSVFTIVVFLCAGFLNAQDNFTKVGTRVNNDTKVEALSSDESKTVINMEVNGFYSSKTALGDAMYDEVHLKEYTSLGKTGQASLPVITKMVVIPNYKDVKINITNTSSQEFDGYEVIPSQEIPLRNTLGEITTDVKDASYYSTNAYTPSEIVSVKEIAVFRDHRVAVITIHPVQYNPATGKLKVYSDINFELEYEGYSDVNNVPNSPAPKSKVFEPLYEKMILNYSFISDASGVAAPRMLIFTADGLYNSITPLADWKNSKGIETKVVKMSEIGGGANPTSTQIKDFFISEYNSSERPDYILIIGDARGSNVMPWFSVGGDKSDHPYSCLAGTDIFPEVSFGRISVQSTGELDLAVSKLIQYEKQPNTTQTDWYKRALVMHSMDGVDPTNGQVMRDVFLNEAGFTNVDMVSPSNEGQITSFLNGGVAWVWFIGHGTETAWADPYWHMSNMPSLNFGERQPSIISIACSNADLDWNQTSDCFGEAWMERETGNSASNFGASTELCAFYTTDTLGKYMIYGYFREGIGDFGSMMNYGKVEAYNYFGGNGTVTATINQYLVLGDPSQEAFSDVPKQLTVITSQTASPEATITVNVKASGNNVEDALVGITQNGVLKVSGYTDAQGDFSFSSTQLEAGIPVKAVVTGRNLLPYNNDIITSISGTSEIPNSFELRQNYPNPFNPVTNIKFSIPQGSFVTLKVYDMLGQEVSTLVNNELQSGVYSFNFDGAGLSSGVYFYKLTAGDFAEIKKMTLIK